MIKLITQKLVISTKLIKNKFKGLVLFEKYEPKKQFVISDGNIALVPSQYVFAATVNQDIIIACSQNRITMGGLNKPGGYDIGGEKDFIIMTSKKPNFIQRNLIKLIFGWNYINKENL